MATKAAKAVQAANLVPQARLSPLLNPHILNFDRPTIKFPVSRIVLDRIQDTLATS